MDSDISVGKLGVLIKRINLGESMEFELSTGLCEIIRKNDIICIYCSDEIYMNEADFCKFVDNLVEFKKSIKSTPKITLPKGWCSEYPTPKKDNQ